MRLSDTKKDSSKNNVLHLLALIQSLVAGLPFVLLLFLYFQYRNSIELEGWGFFLFVLVLLVALSGLIMLREFFQRILNFSEAVQKAARGQSEILEAVRMTEELPEVAKAFQDILQNLKKTERDLARLLGEKSFALSEEIQKREKLENQKTLLASQLLHAQKMQAVGTLAMGVAHDFNNLLMAIQGNVSLLLLEAPPGETMNTRLKNIEKQVESGSRLTRHLLGFSRKGEDKGRSTDLKHCLTETAEAFGRTRKDIRVTLSMEPGLPQVRIETSPLEQVLWNLFINAGDAMPEGGRLYAEAALASPAEFREHGLQPHFPAYVRLEIKDTGFGMDDETLQRAFEPFFTTKDVGKGTGLGLASVKGIVKAHGGIVEVESQPGSGVTVRIYLPSPLPGPETSEREEENAVYGSGTVLLVDDEASVLEVGREMLEKLGYRVFAAENGDEALSIFSAHSMEISAVILDLVMPGRSGAETFRSIRKLDPDARVLLSSGFDRNVKAAELLAEGCSGFIQKPFNLSRVSVALAEILDNPNRSPLNDLS